MTARIGHRGERWIEIAPWHVSRGEQGLQFDDAEHALRFLREQAEPGDIGPLRSLLAGGADARQRLDDAAVMHVVATRLITRTFRAVVRQQRRPVAADPKARGPAPPEPPPLDPGDVAAFEEVRPEPPAVVAETTEVQPEDWDYVAQAATLVLAARLGAPLCEVCQRPRREPVQVDAVSAVPKFEQEKLSIVDSHWIEIQLVGEDGEGIPGQRYLIVTPDGREHRGSTDSLGSARLTQIPAGACKVSFPDLDADAWESLDSSTGDE